MPVTIVCPHCASVVSLYSAAGTCPNCDQPFPEELRASVAAGMARERVRRPAMLTAGMTASFFVGGTSSLFLLLAPFDVGTYTVNGEHVSGPEFLRQLGLLWATACAFFLGIGYGLLRDKSWTRPFILLYWFFAAVGTLAMGARGVDAGCAIAGLALVAGISALYLYGNDEVAGYYRTLQRMEQQ